MPNLSLSGIFKESGLTVYGLSQKIQSVTGESRQAVHKRIKKWATTGIPPKFEVSDRDLRILGYKFEIIRSK